MYLFPADEVRNCGANVWRSRTERNVDSPVWVPIDEPQSGWRVGRKGLFLNSGLLFATLPIGELDGHPEPIQQPQLPEGRGKARDTVRQGETSGTRGGSLAAVTRFAAEELGVGIDEIEVEIKLRKPPAAAA